MRQQDKNSRIYELNVSRAPELRCVSTLVKSCGVCEACKLGAKLNNTKEWFIRCGEPAKRRFILGLVSRFDSLDLYAYVSSILQPLQYKDFTYVRSRCKPSLAIDTSSPPTNHALNEQNLHQNIEDYWEWFTKNAYWTKLNFLLGLMQLCDTHLLFIMASKTRTLYERERRRQRAVVDQGTDQGQGAWAACDQEQHDYMSLCSTTVTRRGSADASRMLESHLSLDTVTLASKSISSFDSETSGFPDALDANISPQGDKLDEYTPGKAYLASKSVPESVESLIKSTHSLDTTGFEGSPISRTTHSQQPTAKPAGAMSDFEREFFSEDYISGEDVEDDDYVSVEPLAFVVASPSMSYRGVSKYKDFIRSLPVHLSKSILGLLDKNSLINCLCISTHWRLLAEEVKSDFMVHQMMSEEIMLMQGASAKGMDPRYAKYIPVHVPILQDNNTGNAFELGKGKQQELVMSGGCGDSRNLAECYDGIPTKLVKMEERNMYCGAYNVLVLQDMEDHNRCTDFYGGRFVVSGSYDRRVRLIDSSTGKCERVIQGHAGSIRCVFVSEERGIVLSGGYDTSIRCWDIKRGNCKCIFRGHRATILCISLHGNHIASGSRDKSVKLWNFATGKCRRTFRHRHVVLAIHVSGTLVISGCEGGKVKVWDIHSATLFKSLDGHHGAITCVKFDDNHVITGSVDCYAMAWSAVGGHKKCLQAFRHPKEVLCLEFLYCRVITGSADGKLRVWNLLNGDCLRVIRGNSKNDAITTICAVENRMVVNTFSNLLIFNFESVDWDYNLPPERPEGLGTLDIYGKHPLRRLSRPYVRAQRLMRANTRDSLPARPPSSTASPAFVYPGQSGTSGDLTKRIYSAPARVRHQDSTLNSISSHVNRVQSARKVRLIRPQSSPANVSLRRTGNEYHVAPFNSDINLRDRMLVTEVRQSYPKPPPLPDNKTPHIISRGRSAPVCHTSTLPADRRGWSTSASEPIRTCENKIMVTAARARDKVTRQRPKSAQLNKVSISINPLKSLSCLNLKTYSNQLQYEESLKENTEKSLHSTRRRVHGRTLSTGQEHRPHSCVPLTC